MINFFDFYFFKEVENTNDVLKLKRKLIKDKNLAIFSEHQVVGRGRLGNIWQSKKGDLTCSFLINKEIKLSNIGRINLIFANILIKVLKKLGKKIEFKFKWPNDIFINNNKISGILIENILNKKKIESLIVGIGINFVSSPILDNNSSISLKQLGFNPSPLNIFFQISKEIAYYFSNFEKVNFFSLSQNLTQSFYKKKGKILIKSKKKVIEGLFREINSDGEIIIQSNDKVIHQISYGEIMR